MICDLHTHSNFSDGTYTPIELVKEAECKNISALALCDHNTTKGLKEFKSASKNSKVKIVCGVEFSTAYREKELHILGLFIDEKYFDYLENILEKYADLKEQSNINLVKNLNNKGYDISYQEIKSKSPSGKINRANIASMLVEKGYVKSINEAFKTLLHKNFGLYVPPKKISSFEVIKLLDKIRAISVLAHPFLNLNEKELREFLPLAVKSGLNSMETFYSKYDKETTLKAVKIAEEFNLLQSGGSDFHGKNKPDIKLGIGKGNLKIPYSVYEKLENLHCLKNIRQNLPVQADSTDNTI